MEESLHVIKRVFENDAHIAFIDLLGIRNLYKNLETEVQAETILNTLLLDFKNSFSDYFKKDELRGDFFDVSIFSDTIIISQRKNIPNIAERFIEFSLGYQAHLLSSKKILCRTIITKDSFFSYKLVNANEKNILGSQHTSVSLCGGRGIQYAHDAMVGLPHGVYLTETLLNALNAEQQQRAIPVINENLFFIKQKFNIYEYIPPETSELLIENSEAGKTEIENSLITAYPNEKALNKILPWVLVHLEKENKITRETTFAHPGSSS